MRPSSSLIVLAAATLICATDDVGLAAKPARAPIVRARPRAPSNSLTGAWSGTYTYPWKQPGIPLTVPFNARIEDDAGALDGEVDEPNTFIEDLGATLFFAIAGSRRGVDVMFVKTCPAAPDLPPIHYFGVVSPDFDRIDGRWVIGGDFSGTFLMERSGVTAETAVSRAVGAGD